jgi:hypothetical protein
MNKEEVASSPTSLRWVRLPETGGGGAVEKRETLNGKDRGERKSDQLFPAGLHELSKPSVDYTNFELVRIFLCTTKLLVFMLPYVIQRVATKRFLFLLESVRLLGNFRVSLIIENNIHY